MPRAPPCPERARRATTPGRLGHRCFASLRWVGMSQRPDCWRGNFAGRAASVLTMRVAEAVLRVVREAVVATAVAGCAAEVDPGVVVPVSEPAAILVPMPP